MEFPQRATPPATTKHLGFTSVVAYGHRISRTSTSFTSHLLGLSLLRPAGLITPEKSPSVRKSGSLPAPDAERYAPCASSFHVIQSRVRDARCSQSGRRPP